MASPTLLQTILRDEWGFEGHVVSDCAGVVDLYDGHNVVAGPMEAAALALNAGCDLNCGKTYENLQAAVETGLISAETIDKSLRRLLTTRFKLGMFDPAHIDGDTVHPISINDSGAHRALSLQASRESIVLLKNDGILPLSPALKRIAVIGPNADDAEVLLGNYNGTPSKSTTVLAGIQATAPDGCLIDYAQGCLVGGEEEDGFAEAMHVADSAELIIFVGGLSQWLEGEEGEHASVPKGERKQDDRPDIDLPDIQDRLIKNLATVGKPIVMVLLNGSALAVNWADETLPAIVEAWYPGQDGGQAVAEVLFGKYNPSGRLPVTFNHSHLDLPPFTDYAMANRTYRYANVPVLYPFGHGLSYTNFGYDIERTAILDHSVQLEVRVANCGGMDGDEVVQVYASWDSAETDAPFCRLVAFDRVHIVSAETTQLILAIPVKELDLFAENGTRYQSKHPITLSIGSGQPRYANNCVTATISL